MLMLFKSLQIFSGILAVLAFLVLYGFTDGLEGFIKLFTNLDLLIDIASGMEIKTAFEKQGYTFY